MPQVQILLNKDQVWVARFVDGPRRGFYASIRIGYPDERPLTWPDPDAARRWMMYNDHTEYTFDVKKYLHSKHTRELLQLRDACYAMPHGYDVTDNDGGRYIYLSDVLAELATREHIPNKAEAKIIRQQRAKHNRSK